MVNVATVIQIYIYMGVVQEVLVLSVVFDDLWYAKMTFRESKKLNLLK